ncbi:MAG: transglutaminase family protein [Candidatus Riflebacteria bacterium]|nr:transglutaminase family protein [Candidatus Riflebacteria bacterium]
MGAIRKVLGLILVLAVLAGFSGAPLQARESSGILLDHRLRPGEATGEITGTVHGTEDTGTAPPRPVAVGEFLSPTRNAQSRDPAIVALANQCRVAVSDREAWLQAARPDSREEAKELVARTDRQVAANIMSAVQSRVAYSFYFDTRHGAVGTLQGGSGNCCDHAHLIVALLRAAGIPARYGRSTCTFSSGLVCGHVYAYAFLDGKWVVMDASSDRNGVGSQVNCRRGGDESLFAELPF